MLGDMSSQMVLWYKREIMRDWNKAIAVKIERKGHI